MNAIETEELTRVFKTRTAVDHLTLTIPTGTVFGLLGPNGAGKTTTARMLAALIAPTAGTARIAGHALGKENQAIRRSVGILMETPGLYDRLSAWENLILFARLYDVDAPRAAIQVEHYLRTLDLWDRRNDRVGGFSKGMRQKLAIARALLHEPAVVFFDEPTSGLDPEASRTVREFIKHLRAEGRTIVLTTHNLPEADELCDLIGIFRTRLLRVGRPDELRSGLFGEGMCIHVAGNASAYLTPARSLWFVRDASVQPGQSDALVVRLDQPDEQTPALVEALIAAGAQVRSVEPITHSLEDVYLQLVSA